MATEGTNEFLIHEIRNQLSNITLSAVQLKHELPTIDTDMAFYVDTIMAGCNKINDLLKDMNE
ncbi:hypothetical protein [Mucilaginibacter ginkgonis]|uniref:Histidine kinase n=1 Tax=Mucilaginibacter ginkgonis TaxID=2682091 RepID=A0A6I4I379_9SPHI|nr:hypothetical protein [Mucilaginibacter ginkgonis]QQL49753.1 hypothetical protein GO620_016530 [Mucilaginibacter ginkgonis]